LKIHRLLPILFLLILAAPAIAAPAISCHCFQDRTFDSARPAAADSYLLATTQNSLMAAVFGLEKKKLVRDKMTGTSGEVLWVAHYLAARCHESASRLMAAYDRNGGSWKKAAAGCGIRLPDNRFAKLLAADASGEELAAAATDEIVGRRLEAARGDIDQIRARGGSNAELILAAYIARKDKQSPAEIYLEVAAGQATWGRMLDRAGGNSFSIEEDLRNLLGSASGE
jgi:hypothetical protein